MSRTVESKTTINCDLCRGTIYGEPIKEVRLVTGYTPVDPCGVRVIFGTFGEIIDKDQDVCKDCAIKACRHAIKELGGDDVR